MATIKMMQGDSWPIFISLKSGNTVITPDLVDDMEVSLGESLRYTMSGGTVRYDVETLRWYILPTQEDTLGLDVEVYEVIARVKFKGNEYVKGIKTGSILMFDSNSEEVI